MTNEYDGRRARQPNRPLKDEPPLKAASRRAWEQQWETDPITDRCYMIVWDDGEGARPIWAENEVAARAKAEQDWHLLYIDEARRIEDWDGRDPESITPRDWYALGIGVGYACAVCEAPVYEETGDVWWTPGGQPVHGPNQDDHDWCYERVACMNEDAYKRFEAQAKNIGVLQDALGWHSPAPGAFPEIVCLCGSTRFMDAFHAENRRLSLEGKIVLTVEIVTYDGTTDPQRADPEQKAMLDDLHLRKIDIARRVHVLNVGGYVGESTAAEIEYARQQGKAITWLETPAASC